MALLSLLFNKSKNVEIQAPENENEDRQLIIIDATKVITHGHELQKTEHPVEEGAKIGDHIEIQPKRVTIEGIVSEAPITITQAIVGNVAGAIPTIGGAVGGAVGSAVGTAFSGVAAVLGGLLGNDGERVQEAFDSFQEIQTKKLLVTLITGLRVYNNMVMINFAPREDPDIGNSLVFTATFEELVFVTSQTVLLPAKSTVQNTADPVTALGSKASETTTKGASILARITGAGA